MDIDVQCTICGSSEASRCARCRSAAYCSLECQQTDWRTHRLLCTKFSEQAQDNYASRPSPTHYLAIFFPMDKKRPSIVWIDTKKDKYEVEPYFTQSWTSSCISPGTTDISDAACARCKAMFSVEEPAGRTRSTSGSWIQM
ncbi:Zinc finger MYND domain-containing protein 10 [Fusarium oxysporum f. sp. raphani]|uniref:Zinc finger MYND domain-containing protein 10 n=1 Tax=Fusarium oxysporum f. sp. raphani TaxID=96318 RepID=A0A8J5PPG5_FUSOX|nr:Zinc finger MYND domain-containing protein 10 [Fusarium oxysporum f. sp. raphani]